MLLELLFELFLDFLAFLGFRKGKRGKKDSTSKKTEDSASSQQTSRDSAQDGSLLCSGCNRVLEKGAIYELEKSWCSECYKTHVLKIKG
jgi:hypothetical protein